MSTWDSDAIDTTATEPEEAEEHGNNGAASVASEDLSQFDDEWSGLKEKRDEPEDGPYTVYVKKAYFEKSKKDQTLVFNWQFCIMKGPFAGRLLFMRNYTKTRENREFFKIALATMGFKFEKFSDIVKHQADFIDIMLEVKKTTKKGQKDGQTFSNVFIQKRIEGELPRNEDGTVMIDGSDESTPF